MGQRLTTLVQGCTDIALLDYVIQELPRDLSPRIVSIQSNSYLQKPLLAAYQRKLELLGKPFAELTRYAYQEEVARLRRERGTLVRDRVHSLRALSRQPAEVLQKQLADAEPETRLEAIAAAALAHVHIEGDLIERLNDTDPDVRLAAHQALVRLARGTDFGPRLRAARPARLKARQRWLAWLTLQREATEQTALTPRLLPPLHAGSGPSGTLERADLVPVGPEVARRTRELLEAPADRQEELLSELRDGKGAVNTETLANAIPQLPDAVAARARAALVKRLTRMTAATLRELLQHEDAEVRRAAALACAARKARDHIPDLLPLLDDPELFVAAAAQAALKALTSEDFGPRADAGRDERQVAVAAWKAWWVGQQKQERGLAGGGGRGPK